MSKATVTRIFIGSMLAVLAGAVLAILTVTLATANDIVAMRDTAIVAVEGGLLSWALLGIGLVAGAVILAGAVGGVAAWIGALLNSAQLESKRWFVSLVVLGMLSVGFLAMIAWLVAGPDGTADDTGDRVKGGPNPVPASPV